MHHKWWSSPARQAGWNGRRLTRSPAETQARGLASRGAKALEAATQERRVIAAEGLGAPRDVASRTSVERLVGPALEAFGRIDDGCGIAGVGAVGSLDGTSLQRHEETLRPNRLGALLEAASRSVEPRLKALGC